MILILLLFMTCPAWAKTVYITPGQWGLLFEENDPFFNGDDQRQPTCQLKRVLEKNGFIVKQANSLKNLEDVHCIIAFDVPFDQLEDLKAYPIEKRFLFLWEPPSVTPGNYEKFYHSYFSRIYTWHDGFVDNKMYHKFFYPVMNPIINDLIPFENRRFATLIAANKGSHHPDELYTARRNAIEFFESQHSDDFDLYGRWWGHYRSYRGSIVRKVDVLKWYKFCICYENIKNVPGYVTEKIFDCFRAGCIPVYWGADNVTDYIPAGCFIDRRYFDSNEQMYQYLKNMSEEEFKMYLNNIQVFLRSSKAFEYSVDNFISIMLDLVFSIH